MARRFSWTQEQVDRTDPDLIEELLIMIQAEGDHQRAAMQRAQQAGR